MKQRPIVRNRVCQPFAWNTRLTHAQLSYLRLIKSFIRSISLGNRSLMIDFWTRPRKRAMQKIARDRFIKASCRCSPLYSVNLNKKSRYRLCVSAFKKKKSFKLSMKSNTVLSSDRSLLVPKLCRLSAAFEVLTTISNRFRMFLQKDFSTILWSAFGDSFSAEPLSSSWLNVYLL